MQHPSSVETVISEMRRGWHLLSALADSIGADLGVTPSMRAVMAELACGERRTVPDIAAERGVSRQHIQKIVNALADQGFVETVENPSHKRSVLVGLTRAGEIAMATMAEREERPRARLAAAASEADMATAAETLIRLNAALRALLDAEEAA